ncbi:MAG: O-acetyltransferase [Parcubacteria group bacterium GW2011_GWA1_36_12]|nr:MAG: O-acetyltransferase [Parcubacteria group bacterium GW2011_GWA1_36_12]
MIKSRFVNWKFPRFDKNNMTRWQWMCQNRNGLKLGKNTDIGAFTFINAKNGVTIEENVQIGSHCSIYSDSTIDNKSGPVKICKNAKIGSHTSIMPNVTIGQNSIIGAHSFVNKNIPPNKMAFGVPVKIVGNI